MQHDPELAAFFEPTPLGSEPVDMFGPQWTSETWLHAAQRPLSFADLLDAAPVEADPAPPAVFVDGVSAANATQYDPHASLSAGSPVRPSPPPLPSAHDRGTLSPASPAGSTSGHNGGGGGGDDDHSHSSYDHTSSSYDQYSTSGAMSPEQADFLAVAQQQQQYTYQHQEHQHQEHQHHQQQQQQHQLQLEQQQQQQHLLHQQHQEQEQPTALQYHQQQQQLLLFQQQQQQQQHQQQQQQMHMHLQQQQQSQFSAGFPSHQLSVPLFETASAAATAAAAAAAAVAAAAAATTTTTTATSAAALAGAYGSDGGDGSHDNTDGDSATSKKRRSGVTKVELLKSAAALPRERLLELNSEQFEEYVEQLTAERGGSLSKQEREELQVQRRTIKNRQYAQTSRQKKKQTGSISQNQNDAMQQENQSLRYLVHSLLTENAQLRALLQQAGVQVQSPSAEHSQLSPSSMPYGQQSPPMSSSSSSSLSASSLASASALSSHQLSPHSPPLHSQAHGRAAGTTHLESSLLAIGGAAAVAPTHGVPVAAYASRAGGAASFLTRPIATPARATFTFCVVLFSFGMLYSRGTLLSSAGQNTAATGRVLMSSSLATASPWLTTPVLLIGGVLLLLLVAVVLRARHLHAKAQ